MNYDKEVDELNFRINLTKELDKEMNFRFHIEAHRFINSLISQRSKLINARRSHKNVAEMQKNIDFLNRQFSVFSYNTDVKMARFFLINQEKIRSLIPGKYPNKRYEDFIELRERARDVTTGQRAINA